MSLDESRDTMRTGDRWPTIVQWANGRAVVTTGLMRELRDALAYWESNTTPVGEAKWTAGPGQIPCPCHDDHTSYCPHYNLDGTPKAEEARDA